MAEVGDQRLFPNLALTGRVSVLAQIGRERTTYCYQELTVGASLCRNDLDTGAVDRGVCLGRGGRLPLHAGGVSKGAPRRRGHSG
ncbi:hypothetical protein GCM10022232_83100 [Streptomyces plumbiresistens]|uniref:Uncharacterized protein n=1 Tax=Streptomyces plumbiresistens TaxID=511811 RepID=A0ABP7TEB1_9ACTN